MSDNIPFEIQEEIIKRLPVKSLMQFRTVSRAWKSLIDSSDFITRYNGQEQHLLVRYKDLANFEDKYVLVADDDNSPQHKVSPTIPMCVKVFLHPRIVGSSRGLFCLYGNYAGTCTAVIWNPCIGRAVDVVVPNVIHLSDRKFKTSLGFGVCPETADPKIVKITSININITRFNRWSDMESVSHIPWQVEVFALSTGAWRSPRSTNLPRTSISFSSMNVVLNGFVYWLTCERIAVDGGFKCYKMIISFYLISEEFGQVKLPDSVVYSHALSMSKLRESLVVLERSGEADNPFFHVWMMEDGVQKSFTKLFTIFPPGCAFIRGFRKTGEAILEYIDIHDRMDNGSCSCSLVAFEPNSKKINDLSIVGLAHSVSMYPYMETLLLLDQRI